MRVEKFKDDMTSEVVTFDSLSEFYKYLNETPFNKAFEDKSHSSVTGDVSFTKTNSFEEAVNLFKYGWKDMSAKITQKLKVADKNLQGMMKQRTTLGVQGYQAIVPLYLNGCPNNMVTKKMVCMKQKVITLNKSICYSAGYSPREIEEESIKAMQIIKRLESQGYRCNLNVVLGVYKGTKRIVVKVRVKNSSEKLNVSKLSFPLVHPSMLRRLFFRFIEVYPGVTKPYTNGYGIPVKAHVIERYVDDNEFVIPEKINVDVNKIKSLDDLKVMF